MTPSELSSQRRPPPTRSCIPCHQRKVRCDKKTPCSACIRGQHRCAYPGNNSSTQSPRRPKSTIAEIAGRLQSLEGTIVSLSSGATTTPPLSTLNPGHRTPEAQGTAGGRQNAVSGNTGHARPAATMPITRDETLNGARHADLAFAGVLRSGNESSEYVNEILLSRVLEEVRIDQAYICFCLSWRSKTNLSTQD